ncbi:MAG: SAM-dependent methyltransferase [Pseudomonadota bacterium]
MSPESLSSNKGALSDRLARLIARGGAIPLSLFMGLANAHYYATRDPLGADGDFITAPEISQMFGELIGLWCADMWLRSGRIGPATLVELGPGRGTLMADVVRSIGQFGIIVDVHMVETSPVLRDLQAAAVPYAQFHNDGSALPDDRPLIILANEFFDALPIRQLVQTPMGWREHMVAQDDGGFLFATGDTPMDAAVPQHLHGAPVGAIIETSPACIAIAHDLAQVLARQGGAMLVIDYGYGMVAAGDTLQAVSHHEYASLLDEPGERDLTAHVDFGALAIVGREAGLAVHGPTPQGTFLRSLGLDARCESLMAGHPDRAEAIAGERDRLAGDAQMGQLFKVLAMTAPNWPCPEGFRPEGFDA